MASHDPLQYTTLITTCNSLITSLSSESQDQSETSTTSTSTSPLSTYISIFNNLDQLFTIHTHQDIPFKSLEMIHHIPLDPLISLLEDFTTSQFDQDSSTKASWERDLSSLPSRITRCIKTYDGFKMVFPSSTSLKLMGVFLQIWKLLPNELLAIDHVISLVGTLFNRNRSLIETFTETVLTFTQEMILHVKQKALKQQYAHFYVLIQRILKNIASQGLDISRDSGSKTYFLETLEQNVKDLEAFINRAIEFFLERHENSKHSGFKQLLKAICESFFQNLTNPTEPLCSVMAFKLLERFYNVIKISQYTLPHKVLYADLILYCLKKNLSTFYVTSQRIESLYSYAISRKVTNFNKLLVCQNSEDCATCSFKPDSKPTEDEQEYCETCAYLLQHLKLPKNRKALVGAKFSKDKSLLSTTELDYLIDFQALLLSLLTYRKASYGNNKASIAILFSCGFDKASEFLVKDDHFDQTVFLLRQRDSQDGSNEEISPSTYNILYILGQAPAFSNIITIFRDLCLILSNEKSCTLRLKATEFLDEVVKACPDALLEDSDLMDILKFRIYDSSPTLRLNILEVIIALLRKRMNQMNGVFDVVLGRVNDISPAIRKAMVTFLVETTTIEEQNGVNDPKIRSSIFITLAKKIYDMQDIATICLTGLLHMIFKSFKPNNNALKKLVAKPEGSKKKTVRNQEQNESFETVVQLLKEVFIELGQDWYYKMLGEVGTVGTIDPEEVVQLIGFLLGKVHDTKENKSFLFGLLKPFSENYPMQFVPELTYFQFYLNGYNKVAMSCEDIDEKRAIRQVCEIIQNVILCNKETFTKTQIKKFFDLERELLQIVYTDTQILVPMALKTICLSAQKITGNLQDINTLFLRCYGLFLSNYQTHFSLLKGSPAGISDSRTPQKPHNAPEIRQILPSFIRSAYILSYIIKYLNTKDLTGATYTLGATESEMINSLYDKFCSFLDKQHGIIELSQAGIECVAALWEHNPLLALKSRDIIYQFLSPAPDTEVVKAMQRQILSIFHSILTEYKQDNQRFLQRLEENFKQRTASIKKPAPGNSATTTPRKSSATLERRNSITMVSTNRKPAEQTSIVQLISECMALVIPHIYESELNTKLLMVRVVLLMVQEGHCHVHTVFRKIFALVGDDNEDVRKCCLEIIRTAMSKNVAIVSLELENALLETQIFEEKHKRATSLYVENGEQERISSYESIYEDSVRVANEKETVLRTCLDAVCTLILTTGNQPGVIRFLCEFFSSLPRVKVDNFAKCISVLRTHIERNYHKTISLVKSVVKSEQKSSNEQQDDDVKDGADVLDVEKDPKDVIEKNQDMIFSLFTALVYTNIIIRISKDSTTERNLLSNNEGESLGSSIENIQRKILDGDRSLFVKVGLSYEEHTIIKNSLNQYFEIGSYTSARNIKDLYKTMKRLYKGKVECMELFEALKIGSEVEFEKKSMSKKKKKVMTKVDETPKKPKIKVAKRNTTLTKKSRKLELGDDERRDFEEFETEFARAGGVFDTDYKNKLRKRRTVQMRDPYADSTEVV